MRRNEELEYVESVRRSELDDSVLNGMLVGVATLVKEETDDGNIGADVNGWSGRAVVRGDGDPEIILIRSCYSH